MTDKNKNVARNVAVLRALITEARAAGVQAISVDDLEQVVSQLEQRRAR